MTDYDAQACQDTPTAEMALEDISLHWVPIDVASCVRPESAETADVLRYMHACPVVMAARMRLPDKVNGSAPPLPVVFHSDGVWVWTAEAAAYVERYCMVLPEDFVTHAAARNFEPPMELAVEVRVQVVTEVRHRGQTRDGM